MDAKIGKQGLIGFKSGVDVNREGCEGGICGWRRANGGRDDWR